VSLHEGLRVAITGARGYLGTVLGSHAARAGAAVVPLAHRAHGAGERVFQLEREPPAGLLEGVDVLLHCAYDLTLRDLDRIRRVNVEGTHRLLDLARTCGVRRTIVLSSMSAYEGTEQLYGRAKLEIEGVAAEADAVTVRPGLVYGPRAGGLVGRLRRLVRLPVVPLITGAAAQFTVHENDFAEVVWALATVPETPGVVVGVANPNPVPFRHLLEALAWEQERAPRFVPVSGGLVQLGLVLAEKAGLPLPIRSDALLGLIRPAGAVPNLEVVSGLGLRLRRFGEPVPATSWMSRVD